MYFQNSLLALLSAFLTAAYLNLDVRSHHDAHSSIDHSSSLLKLEAYHKIYTKIYTKAYDEAYNEAYSDAYADAEATLRERYASLSDYQSELLERDTHLYDRFVSQIQREAPVEDAVGPQTCSAIRDLMSCTHVSDFEDFISCLSSKQSEATTKSLDQDD